MVCPFSVAIRVGLALLVAKTLYDAVCQYRQGKATKRDTDADDGGSDAKKPLKASSTPASKAT